jgi:hypothetical protein
LELSRYSHCVKEVQNVCQSLYQSQALCCAIHGRVQRALIARRAHLPNAKTVHKFISAADFHYKYLVNIIAVHPILTLVDKTES